MTRAPRTLDPRVVAVSILLANRSAAQAPPVAPPPDDVQVRGVFRSSPRGLGDVRLDRDQLTDSPRGTTSEMLSAAPGVFVDHEDGEGLGNDVNIRGFDFDSGSGVEMKVGQVPINVPMHIHGQGYADVNFVIPEVVRSIRVLAGPYDPRQGDAAIAGSALFDLGVLSRGYQLKGSFGSFGQARTVAIAAPRGMNEETFAAVAVRESPGFGVDRASRSASVNAQLGIDVGARDHLRLLATAYAAHGSLPGVVRQDDVNAGRVDLYGAYRAYNTFLPPGCTTASCGAPSQGVDAARILLGAELDHPVASGGRLDVTPWVTWTDFRTRQNFTGNLLSSALAPQLGSPGDLWQTTNAETAAGVTSRFRGQPTRIGQWFESAIEPGVSMRAGHTEQGKSLLDPRYEAPWASLTSYGLDTLDFAAYLDLDVLLWEKLRFAGGVRADFLGVLVKDELASVPPPVAASAPPRVPTDVAGVAPGPRVTTSYEIARELTVVASAGEGFRSVDAEALRPGVPYSKVTSFEGGLRSDVAKGALSSSVALFQTHVANELVFEASSGGLTTESASTRQGLVASLLAKPGRWLLASTAITVQSATFDTLAPGGSHFVPSVASVLFRADVTAHGELFNVRGGPVTGRVGVGYTLLGGRHVTDTILAPTNDILNALVSVRYRMVEVGLDMFNVLGLRYADDEEYYVSNWSTRAPVPATPAVHITAAPPRTTLGTIALYF